MKTSNIDSPAYLKWSEHPARWVTPADEDDPMPDSVFTRRKGIVRFADGTEHKAILDFCESDSNEHYGTSILIAENPECFEDGEGSFTDQGDADFCKRLGKTSEQVFPYTYKYEGPRCEDHHIGEDGWSR